MKNNSQQLIVASGEDVVRSGRPLFFLITLTCFMRRNAGSEHAQRASVTP